MRKTKDVDDCIKYRRCIAAAGGNATLDTAERRIDIPVPHCLPSGLRLSGTQFNPAEISITENGNQLKGDWAKDDAFARRFAEINSTDNYTRLFQEHKQDIETNHALDPQTPLPTLSFFNVYALPNEERLPRLYERTPIWFVTLTHHRSWLPQISYDLLNLFMAILRNGNMIT